MQVLVGKKAAALSAAIVFPYAEVLVLGGHDIDQQGRWPCTDWLDGEEVARRAGSEARIPLQLDPAPKTHSTHVTTPFSPF